MGCFCPSTWQLSSGEIANVQIPFGTVSYTRLFKRALLGRSSLSEVAFHQEVLCPEEKATIHPAIFLPGQIDKVTGASPHSTKQTEIAAALSTTATHAATIAYHLKDAALLDGSIYRGRYRHLVAEKSLFVSGAREARHLKTAALASSYIGTKYFGHWLRDDCIQYLLAQEIASPLCIRRPKSTEGHQQKYEVYFRQDWTPTDRAWIDHLVVYQDFAQHNLKRQRYQLLRDRIKAHFPDPDDRSVFVYLRRGRSGALRLIQNEDEVLDALVKRGFVVVDVASDSLEHILRILMGAKIEVSMEGSQNTHCTFTVPEEGGLLVLQPPINSRRVHRGWSECLGVNIRVRRWRPRRHRDTRFPPSEILPHD